MPAHLALVILVRHENVARPLAEYARVRAIYRQGPEFLPPVRSQSRD